jgi:hypothetical protein
VDLRAEDLLEQLGVGQTHYNELCGKQTSLQH